MRSPASKLRTNVREISAPRQSARGFDTPSTGPLATRGSGHSFHQLDALPGRSASQAASLDSPNQHHPIQRLAPSRFTTNKYKQGGGTCGLYSLGMAISAVDARVTAHEDNLLYALLRAGNDAGTFVGEFMDAGNLAQVGRNLGMTANVINFGNSFDFLSKLNGTGSDGVIMGYSVFENENAQTQRDLAGFEHLFSHWSMIEAVNPPNLVVRDPNTPTATRDVSVSAFHRQNRQTENLGGFSFQDFDDEIGVRPLEATVADLRNAWEQNELNQRAGGAVAGTPLPDPLPTSPLDLKGKIVSVSGRADNLARTSETANLRGLDKQVIVNLASNTPLLILERKKTGRFFKDPDKSVFTSLPRFHYWVKTEAGDIGWVRSNAVRE